MDSTASTDPITRAQAIIAAVGECAAAQLGHSSSDVISEGLFYEPDGTVRFDTRVQNPDGTITQYLLPHVFATPDDTDAQLVDRLLALLDIDRGDLIRRLARHRAINPRFDPMTLFTL